MQTDADIAAPRQAPWAVLGDLVRRMGDIALPPRCLACEIPVGTHNALCARCWSSNRLIERPYCERLGVPFSYDHGPGVVSPEAMADPPPFDRSRAVAHFDDISRKLVHGLKYRDQLELARAMGTWMRRAGSELVAGADLVVPVPLHRRRLWWRRANQSALLAAEVARAGGRVFAADVLVRTRATAQQVGLTHDQRDRNVRGAFSVPDERKAQVNGKRVLLIDDVYTTGATVRAATRTLLRAGASGVDVLTFARVIRNECE